MNPPASAPAQLHFSYLYQKLQRALGDNRQAVLLHVMPVALKRLSKEFLAYDTDNGTYRLPKTGSYLMLILHGSKGLFTTLRRRTPQKERHYRSLVGRFVEVVIEPSPNVA